MPKKALWFVAAGLVALLVVTWRAERMPARVVIVNQSGVAVREVVVTAGAQRFDLGTMRNGTTRVVAPDPGEVMTLTFRGSARGRWMSPEPLRPVESVILYIDAGDRVRPEERKR